MPRPVPAADLPALADLVAAGRESDWTAGACHDTSTPDRWFHIGNGKIKSDPRALAACTLCPLRMPCLAWAIREREADGLWGGLLAKERAAVCGHLGLPMPKPRHPQFNLKGPR